MEIEEIHKCRICGNLSLIPILDLGVHALSGRFPKGYGIDPPKAPLVLVKCNDSSSKDNCGLLQLKHTVSAEEMFLKEYGYRSGLNATMTNHLKRVVGEIEKLINLEENDIVLDIGSNDATLLKSYSNPNLKKIGIDPTGKQFEKYYSQNISLISDFFSEENYKKKFPNEKAKVITSIAMFYDLPDPIKFVKEIRNCLHEEGVWVFEQSYMPKMLEQNAFDTVCHEHLEYYALKQIKWITEKCNLKIIDIEFNEINGGSFRVTVCHNNSVYKSNLEKINLVLDKEKYLELETTKPYEEFKNRIENIKKRLVSFLKEEKSKGKTIYVYGASTKGNTLLQYFGIGPDLITAAAERNSEKYGKRTPLTEIPIVSEEKARIENPDYFIVLPWHFKKEFLKREKNYLFSGGKFIFPLPNFEVIGSEGIDFGETGISKKKKALITGITGQIGSYLAELLVEKGYEVYGIIRRTSLVSSRIRADYIEGVKLIYGDLGDSASIERVIRDVEPDEIYNLAAQSHVWVSFKIPEYTSDINAIGVLRICEATRNLKKDIKIYQASTSELYGGIYNYPVDENVPFYPKSPYGVSKLYAHWIMKNYREAYNMFCCNGIVFNSESPRRGENFVTRKITLGVVDVIKGKKENIRLGNLNAKRDWIHAKDTAKAIWLIMQSEKPDDYVISSGETHSIREFVELAFKEVEIEVGWKGEELDEIGYDKKTGKTLVVVDPIYFRPMEVEVLIGNSTKAQKTLGWKREFLFEELVKDMMEHDLK